MISSEIINYELKDKKALRVQAVRLDSFDELSFFKPAGDLNAFKAIVDFYRDYLVPRYPYLFGTVILYSVDEEADFPFSLDDDMHGHFYDKNSALRRIFEQFITCRCGRPAFHDDKVRAYFNQLQSAGRLAVVRGIRGRIDLLPVSAELGFLSGSAGESTVVTNAGFFLFDRMDCRSIYDMIGIPVGLCIDRGEILTPPLFDREALMVSETGQVTVRKVSLDEIDIIIGENRYHNGINCLICSRPEYVRTPAGGSDIIISGNKLAGFRVGGNASVPSGGFVIHLSEQTAMPEVQSVHFEGYKGITFAMEAGNSAIVDGIMTKKFISPFYDYRRFWRTPFPPATYPHDYDRDRAPRMVLGADADNRPVILWLEGAGKYSADGRKESAGASLGETAAICEKLGLKNAVNLDGGGSAQIIYEAERHLRISDRDSVDFTEKERAVPIGIMARQHC